MTDWVLPIRVIIAVATAALMIWSVLKGFYLWRAGQADMQQVSGQSPAEKAKSNAPKMLLSLTIMPAAGNESVSADILADLIESFGLTYTPEQRYTVIADDGVSVFCTVLNIVRPGNLPASENLRHTGYECRGLMLLLELPVTISPVKDWETFFALANEMAESCGGRLCDDRRRVLSERGSQEYRNRVISFEQQYHRWLQP